MTTATLALTRLFVLVTVSLTRPRTRDERGDVPGWVLITIMTAGLVAVIWGFADDKLVEIFDDAVSDVSPQGN